ncbi:MULTISPECIES: biopolymer transporter ExbD [Methylocystis]|jgi:biopolymer transport protein TolR|uniref:Biopolymer transporter ExbD n=2 Tax=Methylocystis TaxID=133 RepID=A0A3M9XMI2_9HYPH|nr:MULTISPECIES: biopolymer transporter ExbD [Methylocystis]KAF0126330.1 MAG: biopolymer transport protein ExbD/TolR [Methylocystaceae bacterium]KAF0210145.1 MAG: biopolymer transport protein [Methylocystaceae bacterium]MBG0795941.1 biopolymer transporter ExbD [Methylocystis sp. H62]MDP3554252.1 biopolymer transporter ExbD [Methylocystis sp.]PPD21765.1 MAG: protein TolR [Methylocystis sp.]
MGASLSTPGRKGGRRRRGVPRYGAMAEINMTPFIDVMLVLLIIFMVAAPLLATGVAVDLPQTKAGALNIDQKPVSIAIDEKGQVFLMDQPVETTQLLDRLKEAVKQGFDERIYVRGSKAVNYGRVAEVMSLVISAGYKKVALVTEQEKK